MAKQHIRFDDGAAYERMMGQWSRIAGNVFLDWLDLDSRLRWVDVGCGNGAFTELLVEQLPNRGRGFGSVPEADCVCPTKTLCIVSRFQARRCDEHAVRKR